IDEFRIWSTARSAAQILSTYNTELYPYNVFASQTSGGGTGDLSLSLRAISPGAVEGYILVTSAPVGGIGSGPLFGIWPSDLTWGAIGSPLGVGTPLTYPIGIPGVFPDVAVFVPPGTLSILGGQTWDLVAVVLGPTSSYL